jgi:hypothetical protein
VKLRSKKVIALGAAVVIAVSAGTAYAYWSTGGTGTGSATAGTTANNIAISGDPANGISPGNSVPVHVTVSNAANAYSVHVQDVSAAVSTSDPGCLAAWFSVPTTTLNTTIAAHGSTAFDTTLSMTDEAVSQDLCKNATITLTYSSN